MSLADHITSTESVEVPSRSRLYSLAPLGLQTPFGESLTSYVNRLAWAYQVGPRVLVRYEIVPRLDFPYQIYLSDVGKMSIGRNKTRSVNGAGVAANDWSDTLERLTLRSDLRSLNLRQWGSQLPTMGLLRTSPAWCPSCYQEWREKEQSLYQPLLWMLQILHICPLHNVRLQQFCPQCNKHQSIIFLNTKQGYCTQCHSWLGTFSLVGEEVRDEQLLWQHWVVKAFYELHQASASSTPFSWGQIAVGLRSCVSSYRSENHLATLLGLGSSVLPGWLDGKQTPSLNSILAVCYALDVSPVHLLQNNIDFLRAARPTRKLPWPSRINRSYSESDRQRALALMRAVLEDREPPLAVSQIADRLGLGTQLLFSWFPQECKRIVAQYQAHLKQKAEQRMERICCEVREATIHLHSQGIYPSKVRVAKAIAYPSVMRIPRAKNTRMATLQELGIEVV